MTITLEARPEDFATNNDDALETILRIDARRADCDFTLSAIKGLIEGLTNDMPREQIANELGFKP